MPYDNIYTDYFDIEERGASDSDSAPESAPASAPEPATASASAPVPGPSAPVPPEAEPPTAPQDEAAADAGDSQHYDSFLVTVLVNEDRSIRSTTIKHPRTGAEHRWGGWKPEALLEFVAATRSSDISPQPAKPPLAQRAHVGEPADVRSPQSVRVAPSAGLSAERTILRAAEPFTMTMTLDLAGVSAGIGRLAYSAIVAAKPLGGGPKRTVAQSTGVFATASPEFRIHAEGLPEGVYRLEGAVSLREPGEDHSTEIAGVAEGLTLQVLAG